MDDYMFRDHVSKCRQVSEATHYVEILNYSGTGRNGWMDGSQARKRYLVERRLNPIDVQDPFYNSSEEHPLTMDEFDNFLHRRGAFEPAKVKEGVKLVNGIRLVLQKNAKHKDTFTPHTISFTADAYESMVRAMRLPFRAVEGTSVVGPFFWCAYDQDDEDPTLQIIFRKSDVRKKGKTRGWEIMLSHCFSNGITSGYVKGTPSSDIVAAIQHLTFCARQVGHPMLLPIIILSHDLSSQNDQKQRDARDWLRKLEHAVSMRNEIEDEEGYVSKDGYLEVDAISRDLVECHSQVLWKRPQAYLEIVKEIAAGLDKFKAKVPAEHLTPDLDKLHRSMIARLDFYRLKLKGIENYQATTLERLHIQRSARESKIQFQMAGEQRRLAHASKRDSTAMKTISLLGAVFLPGTFLASVFSMTFFDFGNGADPVISKELWVYFAITIPLTIVIVGGWILFDRRREGKFASEDADLEKNIEHMEADIMAMMRKRTMSKANTWTSVTSPIRP
ncbi:MIT CorA-like divalent cation transporter [Colletotrichum incanum]|nr:MIT CorA-like divalent cation transporter [Colletotrichum incanum]